MKRHRTWPWVTGYLLALGVVAYLALTHDQTGNAENGVWSAFFVLMALGGVILWRLTHRSES